MLVAKVDRGELARLSDSNEWLSLGEIVTRTGGIPPEAEALLLKTFRAFRRLAQMHEATGMYVFATEAMRKASNGREVIEKLAKIGLPIDLIDGRREAELGLKGAWIDCAQRVDRLILAEVGGGSAQVAKVNASGSQPLIKSEKSLPLGTGALIGALGLTHPADDNQVKALTEHVAGLIEPVATKADAVIGVGGVARGVWRALHPDGDPFVHAEEIDYLIWATQRLTPDVIAQRFNVKLKRAATLLPGAVVYRTILRCTGQSFLKVSRFGVREGAILEMAEGKIRPCRV